MFSQLRVQPNRISSASQVNWCYSSAPTFKRRPQLVRRDSGTVLQGLLSKATAKYVSI